VYRSTGVISISCTTLCTCPWENASASGSRKCGWRRRIFRRPASHRFYTRLNQRLAEDYFDDFVEGQCQPFYAEIMGRPGLPPGMYFRLLLIGYFEGIDSERGIAWRAADSFALRDFLGVGLEDASPDHSTISRTRRLIDLDEFPLHVVELFGSTMHTIK
jgi:hypothetical protein